MSYALDLSTGPVELTPGLPFTDTGDIQRPGNWIELSSPQARTAAGVKPITEPGPAPDGQRVASLTLQKVGSAITRVATYEAIPLPDLKAAKKTAIDAKFDAVFYGGFTVPAGTPLEGHVLQVRDSDDRTNWLTSQAAYGAQVAQGLGATAGATFRDSSNVNVTVTFAQGYTVLLQMAAWGAGVYGRSWALADAVKGAADAAALAVIDIDAGWPT